MSTLLPKKLLTPRKASRWFVLLPIFFILLITTLSLNACTHHSCEENDNSTRYISLLLNQYINNNYLELLEEIRHKKGVTAIYFASRDRVTLPSQTKIQQCWVSTNNSEHAQPAFKTMSDNSFYTLSNNSNAPCYLNMVIDYNPSNKLWDVHVYNFNPDQLPFSWVYKQVLGNIEVGLYNLTV
ncbi:hypothetical protein [Cysteiniphilum marinum]|uniref:hypothetical protein n=1 Tax=Cysteiniphilum marinum TaxID=2774191 RepID=UPI001939974F|nr:hypothetical protein [Cysteiniphilum marinum]